MEAATWGILCTMRMHAGGAVLIALLAAACSSTDDNGTGGGGAESTPTGGRASTRGTGGDAVGLGGAAATGGAAAMGGTTGSGGATGDPFEQARIDCVDRINGFRATEGLAPLERWTDAEACTDEQAALDAQSDETHPNFGMCNESAQNTCPGWRSVESVIEQCLQGMWDEGPGEPYTLHGHYINMSNPDYTRVACGFYEMPNGQIWASQNFR